MPDRFEGYGPPTKARTASERDLPPPPWPAPPDPRTPECTHDWPVRWGKVGERQRQCLRCERWIWERAIWPAESDGPSSSENRGFGMTNTKHVAPCAVTP